jgi:N-acyl-D-amino-acid deacylase
MQYDLIFEQATVVDGSGARRFRADVAVKGDKIACIGYLEQAPAKQRIDARGKVLCPGFVDIHSHADMSIHLADHPKMLEPLVRQGITTFVGGNCGLAMAPLDGRNTKPVMDLLEAFTGREQGSVIDWKTFGEFLDTIEKRGVMLNTAMLAPHAILRIGRIGLAQRLAENGEVKDMGKALAACLDEGAFGLSTGLQYFPGSQSDTEELIQLARVLHDNDAVFTSHLRSYSNTLDLAIDELKQVSRTADVQAQLSHLFWVPHVHPTVDKIVRGAMKLGSKIYKHVKLPIPLDAAVAEKLDKLGREIDAGLRLGIDGMPTSAGFTHLLAFFPPWVLEGDVTKILQRMEDPKQRTKMRKDIEGGQSIWPHRDGATWSMNFFKLMGWDGAFVMSVVSEKNKDLEGLNFKQIGKLHNKHPFDAAVDLLLEEKGRVLVFETVTRPGDDFVERSLHATMKHPHVSIVTDTILLGYGRPSHLFYDCYPKYIGRYVRDFGAVSLEEGVRKCTSLPASQIGIKKRGLVRDGYYADLVLFDLDTIKTNSTFEKPDVYPDGIQYVLINGHPAVDPDGYHSKPRSGRVLRRQNQ